MLTFKQLEAVYWVVTLGGFAPAAAKLHTTQSAVSKRIHELEAFFDTTLFDRTLRNARLTDKGEEMFVVAKRLIEQRDMAIEQFQRPEVIERRLRLGVTEVTAMTWLPRLVAQIQAFYPKVIIEPDVDSTSALREKVLTDVLDLAIVPDAVEDPRCTVRRVGSLKLGWVCKPGLMDTSKPLRLHELSRHRLLLQNNQSGTGMIINQWLQDLGVQLNATLTSNNLLTMIGLTISGLGITYLTEESIQPMVTAGLLTPINVSPELPLIPYAVIYRGEKRSTLLASVAMLAQECCDFSRMFLVESSVSRL